MEQEPLYTQSLLWALITNNGSELLQKCKHTEYYDKWDKFYLFTEIHVVLNSGHNLYHAGTESD